MSTDLKVSSDLGQIRCNSYRSKDQHSSCVRLQVPNQTPGFSYSPMTLIAHALQVTGGPQVMEDTVSDEHMIFVEIQPPEIRKDSV